MRGEEISIIYATHRAEPHFEWFAQSLALQLGDDAPEIVVIDGLHSTERGDRFAAAASGRFELHHLPAKPNPVNGRHRVTGREFCAQASARNSGVVHTSRPFLVFVDDLAVLMPGWWDEVVRAARSGAVVGGAYQKHRSMVVEGGVLTQSLCDPSGIDHRWDMGNDSEHVEIVGGQLFGSTLCVPRRSLIEINGFDEICNTIGGEDYQLGIRLERNQCPIRYSRRMLTIEAGDLHTGEPVLHREDVTLDEEAYMARLGALGVAKRSVDGAFDASHMMLDVLYGTDSNRSTGNYYELGRLTRADLDATIEHFPTERWVDGRPLADL